MRILLLAGRSTGGIGTHVRDLAEGLRRLGDDVVVVTDPVTADRFAPDARRWWPDPSHPVTAARHLARLRRLAAAADVVHAHGHQAGVVAVLATAGPRARAARRSVPGGPALVVSLHNAVLAPGRRRSWATTVAETGVARRADLVTGASSDLVARAADLGARSARLAPVPAPRVPELLAEPPAGATERTRLRAGLAAVHGLPPDRPLVVTVSRLAPQKDLPTLLTAAGRLRHEVTWCVLGDGDEALRAHLEERVRTERLPVRLLGPVRDVRPWLRAAEVFALSSTWEARALVVQEALAAGTPVVATDTGGLHDLVDGVGRLVPVGDAPGLAAAVDEVLDEALDEGPDEGLDGALGGTPRGPEGGAAGAGSAREAAVRAGRERAAGWEDGEESARRWRGWYASLVSMT